MTCGRRMMTMAALVVATLGNALPARAMDTVTGEVVDLACYLHEPTMKGPGHRKCAQTCAKKGIPMGLLTDSGQVFLLLENHDTPKPYADAIAQAAETITVEGEKVTQGGMNGIVVEAVK